jgi:mono/diheme cytochrome c family protein
MGRLWERLGTLAVIAGICGIVAFAPPASAAEPARGQALYENHCKFCHESWVHERDGRRIDSLAELRQRVAAWSTHSGLDWGDQEIDDVTDYLSQNFYRIKE